MTGVSLARGLLRFAAAVRRFCRDTITPEWARETIRRLRAADRPGRG